MLFLRLLVAWWRMARRVRVEADRIEQPIGSRKSRTVVVENDRRRGGRQCGALLRGFSAARRLGMRRTAASCQMARFGGGGGGGRLRPGAGKTFRNGGRVARFLLVGVPPFVVRVVRARSASRTPILPVFEVQLVLATKNKYLAQEKHNISLNPTSSCIM